MPDQAIRVFVNKIARLELLNSFHVDHFYTQGLKDATLTFLKNVQTAPEKQA